MDDPDDIAAATPERTPDTTERRPIGHHPVPVPKKPSIQPPPGACDAHFHMLGGPAEFPLDDDRPEDPAPDMGFDDWMALFHEHLDILGITRGVVVQSMIHGTDNAVTAETLRRLGPEFRGVALVPDEVSAGTLDRLAHARIKGVRLNYVHGGVLSWAGAQNLAPMLADRDMHVEMLLHAHEHMGEVADTIDRMAVPVVFDHMGWPDLAAGPDEPGFAALRRLLEDGRAWVKLSGVYRFCADPYDQADEMIAALVAANPERCLWGSDWPHILLDGLPMPDAGHLLDAFYRAVPRAEDRQRILVDNPAKLYGF
ncbi:amidohydrolase family protein [Tranquillimonas alkanivorans]|uniref:Predicted metal-dependent hydrolase, TIM-barrel fold n=1 Tax=Tranquillimonas alkanivorans TaxID=441119 RepID=A0A1I5QXD9_9RHOB|nr:amidohydrolase family protein [Tranquillimonas alkanivorans]SFP50905.1 Predicted metal-dependent hydrolase, TIM-barrel fold [Tranquillimonas alkanivorans]